MRTVTQLLILATVGLSGPAFAECCKDDDRENDPSYEVKPKTAYCEGDTCKVYVINNKSVGVIVEGKSKKEAKEKADDKADELNKEAKEESVDEDEVEVFDTCSMFPETCG